MNNNLKTLIQNHNPVQRGVLTEAPILNHDIVQRSRRVSSFPIPGIPIPILCVHVHFLFPSFHVLFRRVISFLVSGVHALHARMD